MAGADSITGAGDGSIPAPPLASTLDFGSLSLVDAGRLIATATSTCLIIEPA